MGFDGHEPLRPLVEHDLDLRNWTVPVHGDDAYQVAVGPIHAGVIESGHFRFHVVGDKILHVDARLFYKHRGLERAAEGRSPEEGRAYAQRACAACAVSNSVAYAHACEDVLGLRPTAELARVRTVLLELERTWNHLNDIAAVCAGAGLAAGNTFFAALTERARRVNEQLTGHRFLFDSVQVGGSALTVDASAVAVAREELASIASDSKSGWRELLFNSSFQDRLPDIGVLTAEDARALGAVGPAARASGVADDVRSTSRLLAYDGFAPVAPRRVAGDVQARLEQRAVELLQTFELLDTLLDGPITAAKATAGHGAAPIGIGRVESPRGATLCAVELDAGRVSGCTFAPAPTRTGPSLPTPPRATCSPTSPSSTRASSSATPARTADADAAPEPPTPPHAPSRCPGRRAAGASRCDTSTPARATAVSTS